MGTEVGVIDIKIPLSIVSLIEIIQKELILKSMPTSQVTQSEENIDGILSSEVFE